MFHPKDLSPILSKENAIIYISISVFVDINLLGKLSLPPPDSRVPKSWSIVKIMEESYLYCQIYEVWLFSFSDPMHSFKLYDFICGVKDRERR